VPSAWRSTLQLCCGSPQSGRGIDRGLALYEPDGRPERPDCCLTAPRPLFFARMAIALPALLAPLSDACGHTIDGKDQGGLSGRRARTATKDGADHVELIKNKLILPVSRYRAEILRSGRENGDATAARSWVVARLQRRQTIRRRIKCAASPRDEHAVRSQSEAMPTSRRKRTPEKIIGGTILPRADRVPNVPRLVTNWTQRS